MIWIAHGGHEDFSARLKRMPRTNLNLFDESELLEINISRWMLRNFRNWMIPLISGFGLNDHMFTGG